MKSTSFFMALIFMGCTTVLCAQSQNQPNSNNIFTGSPVGKHELGIRFGSFSNFDFIYKKKRSENSFFRVRLANADISWNKEEDSNIKNRAGASLNFAIGWEKRKPIGERLLFIHGLDLGLITDYDFSKREQSSSTSVKSSNFSIAPIVGYMVGIHYDLNKRFYLNAESIPSLRFGVTHSKSGDNTNNNYSLNAGFNSNFLKMTVGYRL